MKKPPFVEVFFGPYRPLLKGAQKKHPREGVLWYVGVGYGLFSYTVHQTFHFYRGLIGTLA